MLKEEYAAFLHKERGVVPATLTRYLSIVERFMAWRFAGRVFRIADGLANLLEKHLAAARLRCPWLVTKRLTPHSLRHSLAMNLLQHGVDCSTIALWLGHESIETTAMYLQADMQIKESALAKTTASNVHVRRYRPSDSVLAFLSDL